MILNRGSILAGWAGDISKGLAHLDFLVGVDVELEVGRGGENEHDG